MHVCMRSAFGASSEDMMTAIAAQCRFCASPDTCRRVAAAPAEQTVSNTVDFTCFMPRSGWQTPREIGAGRASGAAGAVRSGASSAPMPREVPQKWPPDGAGRLMKTSAARRGLRSRPSLGVADSCSGSRPGSLR